MRWNVRRADGIAGAVLGLCAEVACAAIISYSAVLDGASESPPNASPAQGLATVTIDTIAHTMRIEASFSDLIGLVTVAHIHCCTDVAGFGTIGVATTTPTFTGFPSGVSSGTYDHLFVLTDPSSWNPAFVTANGGTTAGAEAKLLDGLADGMAYFNIHTNAFPGGEIRGFLTAQVPEPAPAGLLLVGLALLGMALRGRASR